MDFEDSESSPQIEQCYLDTLCHPGYYFVGSIEFTGPEVRSEREGLGAFIVARFKTQSGM